VSGRWLRNSSKGACGKTKTRAFTLIELLVVMVVIAGLIAIAAPRYLRSLEHSEEVMLVSNLANLREVIDQFYADKGEYPDSLEQLAELRYIRTIPQDPITKSKSTWILIESENPDVKGIWNIRSGAEGETREGVVYGDL